MTNIDCHGQCMKYDDPSRKGSTNEVVWNNVEQMLATHEKVEAPILKIITYWRSKEGSYPCKENH